MDKINPINQPHHRIRRTTSHYESNPIVRKAAKPVIIPGQGESFRDTAEIGSRWDPRYQKELKSRYLEELDQYGRNQVGFEKVRRTISEYFGFGGEEARQELVLQLFGDNDETKSFIARKFCKLKDDERLSDFDRAARDRSLYEAKDGIKFEPASKRVAHNWLRILGDMGNDRDISSCIEYYNKIKTKKWKNSPFMDKTIMDSVFSYISRNPEKNPSLSRDLVPLVMEGFNSPYHLVRNKAIKIASLMTCDENFTNTMMRKLDSLSRTPNTAISIGRLSQNLRSKNSQTVTSTSLLLDRILKDSPMKFKKDVLKESTRHFVRYPASSDPETARDTTAVLGKYFIHLLSEEKASEFKGLSSREKLNCMIRHFHG